RLQHEGEQLKQELSVFPAVRQRQGIEAGRRSRVERLILPTERPDENLRAAILVDENELWTGLYPLRLGGDEGQPNCLARPRGADDGEVSEIADVEIIEVSRLRSRLENGDRRPPVIIRRRSARIIMERHEARDIARADDCVSGDIGEIG